MVYVDRHKINKIEEKITGRKFCTTCQSTALIEGGQIKGTRWICARCVENRKNRKTSKIYGTR